MVQLECVLRAILALYVWLHYARGAVLSWQAPVAAAVAMLAPGVLAG